jgi:hypothetical protein
VLTSAIRRRSLSRRAPEKGIARGWYQIGWSTDFPPGTATPSARGPTKRESNTTFEIGVPRVNPHPPLRVGAPSPTRTGSG